MSNEADFYIKQGDTSPPLRAQLREDDGTPVDLTGATVRFKMNRIGGNTGDTLDVDNTATIDDATNGKVTYDWADGDTDQSGYYNAVFGVDYDGSGSIDETFPNEQFLVIKVDGNVL